jgi:hypothetical protein
MMPAVGRSVAHIARAITSWQSDKRSAARPGRGMNVREVWHFGETVAAAVKVLQTISSEQLLRRS